MYNRKSRERKIGICIDNNIFLKKLLTPTLRNSLEYTYREKGKANDDSK